MVVRLNRPRRQHAFQFRYPLTGANAWAGTNRADTTFEAHYSIRDLAARKHLGDETIRLPGEDEPGALQVNDSIQRARVSRSSRSYKIIQSTRPAKVATPARTG
jgi:hypothetical protein